MDREKLLKLAELSKIACSDEELDGLIDHLKMIVMHAESLQDIDTENVPACNHVLEGIEMPTREDVPNDPLNTQTFLKNSPDQVGGMVRVPPVIKF